MIMNTGYPEPTSLPSEPCIGPTATEAQPSVTTERMLAIVVPVAVVAVVLCAVIVGIGVLCCYVIVDRNTQQMEKKRYYFSLGLLLMTC